MIFLAFDIRLGDNLVTHDPFVEICGATELPSVPEVGRGEPSLEASDVQLEKPSVEGIDPTVDAKTSLVINPILYGKWENLEMLDISGDYCCIEMDSKGRNEDVFISWHSILAFRHSPQPRGFIPYGFCVLMV